MAESREYLSGQQRKSKATIQPYNKESVMKGTWEGTMNLSINGFPVPHTDTIVTEKGCGNLTSVAELVNQKLVVMYIPHSDGREGVGRSPVGFSVLASRPFLFRPGQMPHGLPSVPAA